MATWKVDPSHSEVGFKVKHLMITNVKGVFRKYDITVDTDAEDFAQVKVQVTLDAKSIDTLDEKRDNHLRSADFFNVEKYPDIKFVSTSYERSGDKFLLKGDLTINGITNPVELDVDFEGVMKDPYGNAKAGFTVQGKINRKNWNLNWNAALEAGGVLVSDEVRIHSEIQLAKQA